MAVAVLGVVLIILALGTRWTTATPGPTFNTLSALEPASTVSQQSGELLLMTIAVEEEPGVGKLLGCTFSSTCEVHQPINQPTSTASQRRNSDGEAKTQAGQMSGKAIPYIVNLPNVEGPSGGLAVAIALSAATTGTIPVLPNHAVGVTGSLGEDGTVKPVGGVKLKVEAAVRDRAEALLVPESEKGQAEEAAEGRIKIVGVSTVDQAWQWLCRNGGHGPLCEKS